MYLYQHGLSSRPLTVAVDSVCVRLSAQCSLQADSVNYNVRPEHTYRDFINETGDQWEGDPLLDLDANDPGITADVKVLVLHVSEAVGEAHGGIVRKFDEEVLHVEVDVELRREEGRDKGRKKGRKIEWGAGRKERREGSKRWRENEQGIHIIKGPKLRRQGGEGG